MTTETITPEAFAARLDGRQMGKEITKQEEAEAKAAGLVVVFGYSDDNVELRGAIDDEIGAYDGTTFDVTRHGLLPQWEQFREDHEDEESFADYFKRKQEACSQIEALWCPAGEDLSWAYRTAIPHATFNVMEDGEIFCRGIVFRLADVGASHD